MDVQSTQVNHRTGTERTRYPKGVLAIIIFALVTVGFIAVLKSPKSPVEPRPAPAPLPRVDYQALIKQKINGAARQDRAALNRFEDSLRKEIARYEPWFEYAASKSSEKAAKPEAMTAIVYYLAKDQIYKKRETDAYLTKELGPDLDPIVNGFSRDVKHVMDRLEYDLRGISVKLAIDLASIGPGVTPPSQRPIPRIDTWRDLDQALKDLGYKVGTVGVSTVFVADEIATSRFATNVVKGIAAISSRMFAKPIAKAATSSVIAAFDGPLPFGDIASLIGIVWAGYDISQMQTQFQEDVRVSTKNKLDGMRDAMNKRARTFAVSKVSEFKKLQEGMGNQATKQFEGKAGS